MINEFEIRGRDTAIFIETPDGKKMETLISTDDLEMVRDFIGYWYPNKTEDGKYYVHGYGGPINEKKRTWSLHRWIKGDPEGFVIDHRNHDTLDNRYFNLRIVTYSVNSLNRESRTGAVKHEGKWKAQYVFEGKLNVLGLFDTEEDARLVVEAEKDRVIHEIEYDIIDSMEIQYNRDLVRGSESFEVNQCPACDSYDSLKAHQTYNERGETVSFYVECYECGAEMKN